MADQYGNNQTDANRGNIIDNSVDYDPTSDAAETTNDRAYPNHGIDGRSGDDAAKGGVLGAVGGAVVGALAGGPVGAVIGAIAGGIASDAGVAAVDRVDNDNSPGERQGQTGTAYDATGTGATYVGNADDVDTVRDRSNYVPASTTSINSGVVADSDYDANGNRIR